MIPNNESKRWHIRMSSKGEVKILGERQMLMVEKAAQLLGLTLSERRLNFSILLQKAKLITQQQLTF